MNERNDLIESHLRCISRKLEGKIRIKKIELAKRLPINFKYIDWTLGYQVERDVTYMVLGEDERIMYCIVSTFLGLFIIKVRFFIEMEGKFKPYYLGD